MIQTRLFDPAHYCILSMYNEFYHIFSIGDASLRRGCVATMTE